MELIEKHIKQSVINECARQSAYPHLFKDLVGFYIPEISPFFVRVIKDIGPNGFHGASNLTANLPVIRSWTRVIKDVPEE